MKISILIALLSFYCMANAQTPEKAYAQVKYRFIHVRDTLDRNKPYTEDLVLLLSKTSSAYSSLDAQKQVEIRNREIQDQLKKAANPNSLNLELTVGRPASEAEYFQFLSSNKLFTKHLLNDDYLTEEPLPKINWSVTNDTMKISGYQCQKAITHFAGRDYEAWFCTDFPIHTGPWKLNGLPGLILQASDVKKEVIFQFAGFEDVSKKNLNINLPDDVIKVSKKDMDRLLSLKQKDPKAFSTISEKKASKMFGGINFSRINSMSFNGTPVNFSNTINNPIELPEKK